MAVKYVDSAADDIEQQIGRRKFMAGAGAAAMSFTIIRPALVRGTEANSKIRLGMIGCGMRGKWIADIFAKHGGYKIVSAADYFQERADELGNKHGVARANCYATLSGYKRLLDQEPDAVAIESPPYFHPEQAAAAVAAGVHVICAKPIAVDVPGCKTIAEAGQKATSKKQCFFVDFQTRANNFYREAVKRVHYGDIGCRIYGLKGTIDTHYGGNVSIRGSNPYKGGQTGNLYPECTAVNIAEFYNNVTNAQFANPTVAPSVRSNLASILGRIGSYKRHEVSWNEMIQENEKLESDVVKQLKA